MYARRLLRNVLAAPLALRAGASGAGGAGVRAGVGPAWPLDSASRRVPPTPRPASRLGRPYPVAGSVGRAAVLVPRGRSAARLVGHCRPRFRCKTGWLATVGLRFCFRAEFRAAKCLFLGITNLETFIHRQTQNTDKTPKIDLRQGANLPAGRLAHHAPPHVLRRGQGAAGAGRRAGHGRAVA